MKTKIYLDSEKFDTVFVDDVDVSKGVIEKYNPDGEIGLVFKRDERFQTQWAKGIRSDSFLSLREIINKSESSEFHTLDGRRITAEKRLTVDDLKDGDIVGFIAT